MYNKDECIDSLWKAVYNKNKMDYGWGIKKK